MSRSVKLIALVALCAAGALAPSAAKAQLKPEELVKMRQGLMVAQKSQFGPMGAVAKGEAQMSDATVMQAQNLANVAKLLPPTFSQETSGVSGSKAKKEIWQKQDEFKKAAESLLVETAKLAEVAQKKDPAAFKTQYAAAANACKNCHDQFREK
jgi:cytochrome c556